MTMRRTASLLVAGLFLAAGCGSPKVSYKGLKLVRGRVEKPTGADVEKFIEQIRAQAATARPLGPGAALKMGNRAVIDFVGSIGGTPFAGGTGSGYALVLGSGSMIPGFEEGIVGMTPGQAKTLAVTFPKDYQEAALAGKAASYRITVR
ncbi:MAG: FKBP-type peptidyl-prolyl cis-trans isomerase, partial [bacterium]